MESRLKQHNKTHVTLLEIKEKEQLSLPLLIIIILN